MKIFNSEVRGSEGPCTPTWINRSLIDRRVSGGITGFFRNVKRKRFFGIPYWSKYGLEFHGMFEGKSVITKTMEGR